MKRNTNNNAMPIVFDRLSSVTKALALTLLLSPSTLIAQTAQDYLAKGDQAFASYQLPIAERNYRLALRKDAQSIDAYNGLVNVYQAQRRYEDGVALLDKATKQFSTNAELWVSKGLLLRGAGDIQKSNEAYMQAVKFAQRNSDILRQAEDHFYSVGNQILAREIGIQRKQLEAEAQQ